MTTSRIPISLPIHPMTIYRIRYSIYRINASDSHEARQKVADLLRQNPKAWFTVEPDRPRRGFLRALLLGP